MILVKPLQPKWDAVAPSRPRENVPVTLFYGFTSIPIASTAVVELVVVLFPNKPSLLLPQHLTLFCVVIAHPPAEDIVIYLASVIPGTSVGTSASIITKP